MKELSVVGIDLAKNAFHAVGMSRDGRVLFKKKLSRNKVTPFLANLPVSTVAMESCSGAHFWGRQAQKLGHVVRLIPPQFVKPFVKSNKNDLADAEAICEAALRPSMRFTQLKTVEAQELQMLHRARSILVKTRTALTNSLRGLLSEFGMIGSKNRKGLKELAVLLELNSEVSPLGKEVGADLLKQIQHVDDKVKFYDRRIELIAREHPVCRALSTIPGVGPMTATAIVAAVSDPALFNNGRQFAAWLGLVPKQASTGGKVKLLGMSKRGDAYIRTLLVHGARSLLYRAHLKDDRLSRWAAELRTRKGWNISAVAIANKNARIIWSVFRYQRDYDVALALPA